MNLLLQTDSYKLSHPAMFPPGMTYSHFYIEARSNKHYDALVFFGLQQLIKKHLLSPITMEDIRFANEFSGEHFGNNIFPYDSWKYIYDVHGGYLPIIIKSVPEGTLVPTGNVLMTIESTDPRCAWLPGWLETLLLRVWYPTTVATKSYFARKLIKSYLDMSSDDPKNEIWFKLHDFGARACTSSEQAEAGGAAHLVNFMGSDTLEGIYSAYKYYGEDVYAHSVSASEHSVTTSFGSSKINETQAYKHFINCYLREGKQLACVVDSYDSENALKNIWGSSDFVSNIKAKKGTVILRVDSGDPVQQVIMALRILEEKYGYTINSKGYRVLNNVRVIQGDGIDVDTIDVILREITQLGYSATNVTFGMGGSLLQKVNRDTLGFAQKLSNVTVKGVNYDVYKDPKTDPGKRSKEGRLGLFLTENGDYITKKLNEINHYHNVLQTVFCNGKLLIDENMTTIRNRLHYKKY
jgi:nicotinamide phosphoribosyltransferase